MRRVRRARFEQVVLGTVVDVPRIAANTVAEHRTRQRAALLRAAEDLLREGGYDALSFGALAARTGLARPSVYKYFVSRDDLVAAVCEEVLPQWLARITETMARARTPRGKLTAYVRVVQARVSGGVGVVPSRTKATAARMVGRTAAPLWICRVASLTVA